MKFEWTFWISTHASKLFAMCGLMEKELKGNIRLILRCVHTGAQYTISWRPAIIKEHFPNW